MLFALFAAGCTKSDVVGYLMHTAHRPDVTHVPISSRENYTLLAGDLHCHVSPPDHPSHVSRDLYETVRLAQREGLDFVVLTPHVWSRFHQSEELRTAHLENQRILRDAIRKQSRDVLLIAGAEYTDHEYGHVGMAFANVEEVLKASPLEDARYNPEHFIEEWVRRGGTLVVNHPFMTPVDSIFSAARANLSWRLFIDPAAIVPGDIAAVHRLAHGYEAYNMMVSQLRDGWVLGDRAKSIWDTVNFLDKEAKRQERRMTPVGGSDSHDSFLRATTFVLASQRTEEGIADGIRKGRTCVRDPHACTLRARSGEREVNVGGSLSNATEVAVTAEGREAYVFLDGKLVAKPEDGRFVSVKVDSKCSVLRAYVDRGFSAPIYVNCAWAK